MNRTAWQVTLHRALDRIPLTGRGFVVVLCSGLAASRLGYGSLDLVALTLGVAGLGLVCAAGLVVGGFTLWLRRRLRDAPASTPPARTESGSPFETGFALPLPRWLPIIALEWNWQAPPNAQCRVRILDARAFESVRVETRCEVNSISRRFSVGDVFGLWRVVWVCDEPVAVTNLPSLGALRRIGVVHSLSGGEDLPHPAGELDGDRMEIRRYAPGDPVRHILWKAFARTRDLYVRTPERSLAESKRTLAYLVVGEQDEAAAAALRVALQSGAFGEDWTVGADGIDETTDELSAALSVIARSGNPAVRERGGASGLEAFLQVASRGSTRCVVFAPAACEAWLETALAAVAAWPGTRFVLAADGVASSEEFSLWRRALLAQPEPAGVDLAALSECVARIASAGCAAVFVDRVSGRVAGENRLVPMRRSA
jgi:hypothetical protein